MHASIWIHRRSHIRLTFGPRFDWLAHFAALARVVAPIWLLGAALPMPAGLGAEAPSTIQFSANAYQVIEGHPAAVIEVQRSNDLDSVAEADLSTEDGTAKAGSDYVANSILLTFLANETRKSVAVPILNDGLMEPTKSFRVKLKNPTGGALLGSRSTATVSIKDNDSGWRVELPAYSVNEEAGSLLIRVVRQDDGEFPVSLDYATSDGTALASKDYTATSGTMTFAPGETVKSVMVRLLNDAPSEPNVSFRFSLRNPTGSGTLGSPSSATVTILDTDEVFGFESPKYTCREDCVQAWIRVVRGENQTEATVELTTQDVSAVAGRDYLGLTNTLRFAAGERAKRVGIPIINDSATSSRRALRLTLSNPTGKAVLGAQRSATLTIADNDPGIGFERNTYSAREDQDRVEINVLRGSDDVATVVVVEYSTEDGTALAGRHYESISGLLKFESEETVRRVVVPIIKGSIENASKTFRLNLRNPSSGNLSAAKTTTITISDSRAGVYVPIRPLLCVPTLVLQEGESVRLEWSGAAWLARSNDVLGPWEEMGEIQAPYSVLPTAPARFFRIASPRGTRIYVPTCYDGRTPLPLLLVLHGYGGDSAWMENYVPLLPQAESRGIILCYPEGTLDAAGIPFWNATEACCNFYESTRDDSGFLRSVIEAITNKFAVDRKRIYVTGVSNGGFMSHRMARDHADLIAGIAGIVGCTFLDPADRPPSERVNILQIHGTADETVPYLGGSLIGLPVVGLFPGAEQTVRIWAGLNGCSGIEESTSRTMDLDLDVVGMDASVMRYTNAPPGGAVELWTVHGGTHVMTYARSGATSQLPERLVDWLLAHPKP